MKNILNRNDLQICATKKYDEIFRDRITAAVDVHRQAIQLVHYLNRSTDIIHD